MVFQNYALYPHMSVFDNMAYGLRIRGLSRGEIARKVAEAADLLGLDALLARKPRQLSGGQRQRVAMGRAIVRDPKLFLFDEPLSNLDAKLRIQMRAEIRKLQRRLGVTSLYVTHDQVEAMTLGDRLLILHQGTPAQLATPMEVFERPADTYVAGFVGAPTMNFLPGRLVHDGTAVQLDAGPLIPLQGSRAGDIVTLGIRPEHLTLGGADLTLTVDLFEPLGSETLLHGRVVGRDNETIVVKVPGAVMPCETISVAVQPGHAHVFDQASGKRIDPSA
jgi:sn-glycerol 3-phosphate transport system ATP-binding protein